MYVASYWLTSYGTGLNLVANYIINYIQLCMLLRLSHLVNIIKFCERYCIHLVTTCDNNHAYISAYTCQLLVYKSAYTLHIIVEASCKYSIYDNHALIFGPDLLINLITRFLYCSSFMFVYELNQITIAIQPTQLQLPQC